MALFKRTDLKAKGFSDEQIEWIMTEGNRKLATDYTLTSDVQGQIDAALKAQKPQDVVITETEEYKAIAKERDMLRAIGGEDFAKVKPKFREAVFGMIDRSEGAPAIGEQLKSIGEKYEEYFTPEKEPETQKPTFGAPTQGSVPTGSQGPSFMDTWGFVPKK